MALHPQFPKSPYAVLRPDQRWFPAAEEMRERAYEKLLPPLRSLIEFSLKANAPRFGIIVTYVTAGGRTEDKSLKHLGEDVAIALPELEHPIEIVRDTGNRILHPKKHDVISHPKVMRSEALQCIKSAQLIVEKLYSEVPRSSTQM